MSKRYKGKPDKKEFEKNEDIKRTSKPSFEKKETLKTIK